MKLIYNKLLLLLTLCLFAGTLSAQRTVTGTVIDQETSDPLIGANILIEGTSTGTITDFDGNYTIDLPAGKTKIVFSYTGYAEQIIEVGASNILDVQLTQ